METKSLFEEFQIVRKLKEELSKETDRGCCLMAVSYIDHSLEILISNKLIGSNVHKRKLFTNNGPLNTLSSRIDLAYSIGLLSNIAMSDLNIIRKIRNTFGHSFETINFNTEQIKQDIIRLKSTFYNSSEIKIIEPKEVFILCISGILAEIHSTNRILDNTFTEQTYSKLSDPVVRGGVKSQVELLGVQFKITYAKFIMYPDCAEKPILRSDFG